MTEAMIVDESNTTAITTENNNESQTANGIDKKKYSIQNIPRLPRELTPFASFSPAIELHQRGPLFKGPGAKRDTGRYKIRSVDEENIKRAKKYGQFLRVGKAITPPEGLLTTTPTAATSMPTATALAVATITAQLQAKNVETNPQPTIAASQMINNPIAQVGFLGGPIPPTTVAATISAASFSDATAVTSMISTILNPTAAITTSISQPVTLGAPGIRSNLSTSSLTNLTTSSSVQTVQVSSPQVSTPPPSAATLIPQPTLLEEPPVPVGLKIDLEPKPQYPSISLVLPTNKSETTDNQKTILSLNNAEDPTATLSQQEELSVKGREQRHLLMQKLNQRRLDSRVCVLRNMVGPEDVDDDLQQEITDECSKYGEVIKVVIYTEQQGYDDDNAEQIVKIFVEFQTSKQAEKTIESLNGRYFAGRMIKAELYDQMAYQAEDLSG
ncbi:unnamed protein product [Rotaria socialis]|uniref:RRM domain-containing protein n=1 Tax=Rotaria socialis TaxID=392032 RepID=A0A820UCK9_9BILA|nr:unnamed protein product [Rotaria socialis]